MFSAEMIEIVAPAVVAGLMIALTSAPLGIEVLRRGIIFIDLAIAQIAGLGLIVTTLIIDEPAWYTAQLTALAFALLGAFFFRWVERRIPDQQEAIIGSSFVIAASMALLLLANHPHGGEEIQHLLSGQILFVTWTNVMAHVPIYAAILIFWFAFPNIKQGMGFYILFALAITSSVQLAGVYVVFTSLILPALAVERLSARLGPAWAVGAVSVLSGMFIATVGDLPTGPVIVMAYLTVMVLFRIFSHKNTAIRDSDN